MGLQQVLEREITSLRPYPRNARTHSKKQIKQIAVSIERFGFTNPVLVSDAGEIIAGHGHAEHTNSFGLGQTGRYRTNVWDYAGISSIGAGRAEELAMHPTVKPVALIADTLRDCSRRGEIVLDGFGGSGSTLIAAEKTGRIARLIEYDPLYCDTIIRRWEKFTGKRAVICDTGSAFEDVADDRRGVALETAE